MDYLKNIKNRMKKCLELFKIKINKIKTGRVSIDLLDGIFIDYYGSKTPLNRLGNIVVENSNTLKITVFDNSILKNIEKSIFESHLEINPITVGNSIRIVIPALTEERRKKLSKILKLESEKSRIAVRNIRRDANDELKRKNKNKNKIINQEEYSKQNEIQALTDNYIKKIDTILLNKQSEIMNF